MVFGKEVRLNRITKQGKLLCVTMDHGVSSGPIRGLEDMGSIIEKIQEGGATAFLVHKGIIRSLKFCPSIGIIMHLSGSTSLGLAPNLKVRVSSVEEGIRLGADAISVHINIGCKEEPLMLEKLGNVADECDKWGIPFLAMMYPRGENIKEETDANVVAHVARVGAELGADIVKTVYTGSPDTFKQVVKSCPVPVAIAGGPKAKSDKEVLEMAKGAMEAGAIGVTFGRNIFQHDNPKAMVKALEAIVIKGYSVNESLEVLKSG
ncbi:MAG: 2-amino-3,7-dideoxy-D-threo-hept-6-ulosonate synthase [Nitrososphaerales archaeon]